MPGWTADGRTSPTWKSCAHPDVSEGRCDACRAKPVPDFHQKYPLKTLDNIYANGYIMDMKNTTATTDQEARETIRQMLKDWNAATDEQRAEALRIAADRAEKAMAR